MNERKHQFLRAVAGDDGARALSKAAESCSELAGAIYPRAILAWLGVVSQLGFSGELPGSADIQFDLNKSDALFNGRVTLGEEPYLFNASSLYHVAGSLAVALGVEEARDPILASGEVLASLGKSIDLLVRSRAIRAARAGLRKDEESKPGSRISAPGQVAKPRLPAPPDVALPQQPHDAAKRQGSVGTSEGTVAKPTKSTNAASAMPKSGFPKLPVRRTQIKITKAQAAITCASCRRPQFANNQYVGCIHFADLAKSVKTTQTISGFILEFGKVWDPEAVATLVEMFGAT